VGIKLLGVVDFLLQCVRYIELNPVRAGKMKEHADCESLSISIKNGSSAKDLTNIAATSTDN